MTNDNGNARTNLSRRTLLRTGALTAAGALSGIACGGTGDVPQTAAPRQEPPRTAPPNIKVSMAAYSMRDQLKDGKQPYDLFAFMDWCAGLDLAGVELTSYYFAGTETSYLHELKRHAHRCGLTISGTAIRNDFCHPAGEERDRNIAHVKEWIDHSVEFFAPHIRIFAGAKKEGQTQQEAISLCADGIRECLDYAAERGVFLGLENHGGITARATDLLAIVSEVGEHPWFGVNLDTGNFVGEAWEDAYADLAKVADLAVNVQYKVQIRRRVTNADGEQETEIQYADMGRVRDIIENAGYRGWLALEYEDSKDPMTEIPGWVEKLQTMFEGC